MNVQESLEYYDRRMLEMIRDRSRSPGYRIWREENDFGDARWFWMDDHCEEPMGPFDSHIEAVNDWAECRPRGKR